MKNLKYFLSLTLMIFLFVFSCQDTAVEPDPPMDLSNLDLNLDLDMDFSTTYSLKEKTLAEISREIAKELYSEDYRASANLGGLEDVEGVSLEINPVEEIVIVTPIDPVGLQSDDKKCGGKEGDGWTSFGKCFSDNCVENKIESAAKELAKTLEIGQCLDLRVVRNVTHARVCGRIKTCE